MPIRSDTLIGSGESLNGIHTPPPPIPEIISTRVSKALKCRGHFSKVFHNSRLMAETNRLAMAGFFLLVLLFLFTNSMAKEPQFDIKQHLSTSTRYGASKGGRSSIYTPAPAGCVPIHLNLVARHGTRAPTKKRLQELNDLEDELEILIRAAVENGLPLNKIPSWMKGWKSLWRGKVKCGELIPKGEEELHSLGIRTRRMFPELFKDDYHPEVYTIKATQVPRASASAVAFGMGLFNGRGSLGSDRHRAFSVISESRASDTMLRFFECCTKYKDYKKSQEPAVDKVKKPVLDLVTKLLNERHALNFTRQHTSSLWFLCKQEAALLDITDQACGLFIPSEVVLLEWTDDVEVFMLKGYGNSLNYKMGYPLLEDIVQSMEQAILAKEEKQAPGSYEKARLRFAHAETLLPFSCLLGLFVEEPGKFRQTQMEEPLKLPPRPPASRVWRASAAAPFAGNNMLVLYSCPASMSDDYFVRVLHNEEPIGMPGCGGSDFCSFEDFKEKVVAPHLTPDFNSLCTPNVEELTLEPEMSIGPQSY